MTPQPTSRQCGPGSVGVSGRRTTAVTADGVVMAVEHRTLPMAAVQFHPESILTNPSFGLGILSNCLNCLSYDKA